MKHRTGAWLVVAVGLACLVLGFVLGGIFGEGDLRPERSQETVSPEEEVVAVAARYLIAQNQCSAGLDACLEVMEEIAAPRWMPKAGHQAEEGVAFLEKEYGEGARIETGIVSYRLDDLDADSGNVAFWAVSVFSSPSRGPESVWAISEMTLERIDGRWLVVAQGSTPGPTPESLGASRPSLGQGLEGFEPYTPTR